jgi:hypothetical protein
MNAQSSDLPLLDRIVATPRREKGGSIAANRTDYQQSWAFCLLLVLHEKPNDYAVLLDFHDDVVVLDSSGEAKEMEFYQVKSKETGNWTITQLLKCPKKEKGQPGLSICGKMYSNKLEFPNVTKSVNFVTNTRFNVPLKVDEKEQAIDAFEVNDLTNEIASKIRQSIQNEHGLAALEDVPMHFRNDPLPHREHQDQVQGRLVNFLEKQKPNGKFMSAAAYRSIASTIARKTGDERTPTNRKDLLLWKAITRTEFAAMLTTILKSAETERWGDINGALLAENFPYGSVKQLSGSWNKYEAQQMDAANTPVQKLKEYAARVSAQIRLEQPDFTLRHLITEGVPRVKQLLGAANPFDDNYLTAALLYHSHEEEQLSPAAS